MGRKNARQQPQRSRGAGDEIKPPTIDWSEYEDKDVYIRDDPYSIPIVWPPTGPEHWVPKEMEEGTEPVRAEEVGLVGRTSGLPTRAMRVGADTHEGQVSFNTWADQVQRTVKLIEREAGVRRDSHAHGALMWIMACAVAKRDSRKRPVWILDPDQTTRERITDAILLHVAGCKDQMCAGLESAEAKAFWGRVMDLLNGDLPAVENAYLRKRPYECLTCGKRYSLNGLKSHHGSKDPRVGGHTGVKAHR